MIGDAPSNIVLLERIFKDGIFTIKETDSTGRLSTIYALRATIIFVDHTRLYVTEHLKHGKIISFQYDWVDQTDKILGKYHGEAHDDEDYKTETEPYHVHPPDDAKLTNKTRFPNYEYRDLFSIVEGIYLFSILPNKPRV